MKVTKRVEFDAAHRLYKYNGPCANFHGHRYVIDVTIDGPVLENGMVVDFKILSRQIKDFVMEKWDHALIMNRDDPKVQEMWEVGKVYIMKIDGNPTAENMVLEFWNAWKEIPGTTLVTVRLYETPDSWAEMSR